MRLLKTPAQSIALLLIALGSITCADEETAIDTKARGAEHVAAVAEKPWASAWRHAKLANTRRVEEKADLERPLNLPPVWHAHVEAGGARVGYLMWDAAGDGRLIDFAVDARLAGVGPDDQLIMGVPPLQQFRVEGEDGDPIASGCVPTSAGSVVAHVADAACPAWRGDASGSLEATLTRRFRRRMAMTKYPDHDGYTDDGMALAGATARELARAIREDARERGVAVAVTAENFGFERYRSELRGGRPTIVMCTARLPHKPHLSWGHSVAGVGATEIAGVRYVGFLDNWYPSEHPTTVRWLEADAFNFAVIIHPGDKGIQNETSATSQTGSTGLSV